MARFEEFFDRFKDRKTHKIAASKVTAFHGEYSKKYTFPIPLHPKNLAQMTHPWYGYLGAMEEKSFDFKEMQEIYLNQIASGYEKTFGRVLLGEELCCLSYWLLQDPSNKGYMTLGEFSGLLKTFKFGGNLVEDELTV